MNLLFNLENWIEGLSEALNIVMDFYKPQNCYAITSDKEVKNIKYSITETYSLLSAIKGDYDQYIFADECPPVDEDLIVRMRPYEPSILKMLERYVQYEKWLDGGPSSYHTLKSQPLSYDSRVRLYYKYLRYWDYMLDKAEIDVVILFQTPHAIVDTLIYYLCKEKNIGTFILICNPHLLRTCVASNILDPCPSCTVRFEQLREQYKNTPVEMIPLPEKYEQKFLLLSDPSGDRTPYYMTQWKFLNIVKRKLPQLLKLGTGSIIKAFQWVLEAYARCYKLPRALHREYDKRAQPADYNVPYIYFALHFEPECQINPLGGVFTNQFLAIQMLSYYVPSDVKIYVKDHPKQTSFCRDIKLYDDIVKLPRVQLVPRGTDTYELMRHCKAVATITGTAGFEGMMIGKPFLMFGSYFHMYAPGVFNIRTNSECKNALDYIFTHGAKHSIKDMKLYLKALIEESEDCVLTSKELDVTGIPSQETAQRIARGLISAINEYLNEKQETMDKLNRVEGVKGS